MGTNEVIERLRDLAYRDADTDAVFDLLQTTVHEGRPVALIPEVRDYLATTTWALGAVPKRGWASETLVVEMRVTGGGHIEVTTVQNRHMERIVAVGRALGPVPRRHYRVLVFEADGRTSHRDIASSDAARRYANDAVTEDPDNGAWVLLSSGFVIYRGLHYISGEAELPGPAFDPFWTPLSFSRIGDGEFPYGVVVGGSHCVLRINDFPEEPYFTLLVDGLEHVHFDADKRPESWSLPGWS